MEKGMLNKAVESAMNKHKGYNDRSVVVCQGMSKMMTRPSTEFPANNPLSGSGRAVMSTMKKQYGAKKGKQVFYASINKGVPGSSAWER